MNKFYNVFGQLKYFETFDDKDIEKELDIKNSKKKELKISLLEEIKLFRKKLENGTITKNEVMLKMDRYNELYRADKLTNPEINALKNLESTTRSKMNGIGLRGNLDLGGIIRAKGFYLQDGTKLNEVTKVEKKLAIPIDKKGNISFKPPAKQGKINMETNIDIATKKRSGINPKNQPSLYVTGDSHSGEYGQKSIAEFRHTNQNQGIGIGYNTIYATGNHPNQSIHLKSKGLGVINLNKKTEFGSNIRNPGELHIHNSKTLNNKNGYASYFNYKKTGRNYIRGNTTIEDGEFQIVNPKNKDNKTGLRTQFNHKNSGNNYIRGKTEIVGSELKVITKKGITHHGHGKVSSFGSLNSGWCHLITNAPQFYMNKNLQINGSISSYHNKPINCNRGINASGNNLLQGNTRIKGNLEVDSIKMGNYHIYPQGGNKYHGSDLVFHNRKNGKKLMVINANGQLNVYPYAGRRSGTISNLVGRL